MRRGADLRTRLTPRRRTLRGKPWAFGGPDSHRTFATHASILTSSRSTLSHDKASLQLERSPTNHRSAVEIPSIQPPISKQISNHKFQLFKHFFYVWNLRNWLLFGYWDLPAGRQVWNLELPSRSDGSSSSVHTLASINFRCIITRPVSCYAFFKGWLLLSQPPGCLGDYTSFHTQV